MARAHANEGVRLGVDYGQFFQAFKEDITKDVLQQVRTTVLETFSDVFQAGVKALTPNGHSETTTVDHPRSRYRGKRKFRNYTPEFKQTVVRAALEIPGRAALERVAHKYRISSSNIYRWIPQYRDAARALPAGTTGPVRANRSVDRGARTQISYKGKTLSSWVRGAHYRTIVKDFLGSDCALCEAPWGDEPILVAEGMSLDDSVWFRVRRFLSDLNTKDKTYIQTNYRAYCRSCIANNRGETVPWYRGSAEARRVWLDAVDHRCQRCREKPKHIHTLLLQGVEGAKQKNYKNFYRLYVNEGGAAAVKKFPSICRSCVSRARHATKHA